MDFNAVISQLADIIAATQDFKQLQSIQNQIKQDKQLNRLLSQFESKQKLLYSERLSQSEAQKLMAELDNEFNSLNTFPAIKNYFMAQERVNRIIQDTMQNLNMMLDKRLISN